MYQIFLSKFLKRPRLNYYYSSYEIVIDISKEEFLKQNMYLYEHLLYPLFYRNKNVVIKDYPFPKGALSISPLLLHTNIDAIFIHLYLEAWETLKRSDFNPCLKKEYILDKLNIEQKKAVNKIWGPVCLLAPAGSGKTKTLVNRVMSLFNHGVKKDEILLLVFNKKAEKELMERLSFVDVEIRTFHSFGNQLLKQYTDMEFFQEDPVELENTLLEQAISNKQTLLYGKNKDPLKEYRSMLSRVKNELLSRDQMIMEIDHQRVDFYPIFQEYLRLLKEEKLYDYDDMLYISLCLLLKDGSLRRRIQAKYKFLLVDEFQDLNPVQLLILKIIALPKNHLFVVGDDDQMIYGFRGARIDSILHFKKMYYSACYLKLSINYRSKRRIVYHARQLIEHNLERVSKQTRSFSKEEGNIQIAVSKDFKGEATSLLSWILSMPENMEVAILYRYQVYGIFLKVFFTLQGIGNQKEELVKYFHFFITLLEFFLEPFSISRTEEVLKRFSISNYKCNTIEEALKKLDQVSQASRVYNYLLERDLSFRYFCLLLRVDSSLFFEQDELEQDKIFSILDSLISYFGGVKGFYQSYLDNKEKIKRNIIFDTIHKTKGNEFDAVGYFHMEYPSNNQDMEDERRISYVALTRAKSDLFITTDSYQAPKIFKEYFYNPKFEGVSDTVLNKQYISITNELEEKKNLYMLRQKDQNLLQKRFQYEVQENVKNFYHIQNRNISSLKQKVKRLENDLFYYHEELWVRSLLPKQKYDIIVPVKKEGTHE